MTVKLKTKKILGLILAIYLLLQIISLIIPIIVIKAGIISVMTCIRFIPSIILSVGFL